MRPRPRPSVMSSTTGVIKIHWMTVEETADYIRKLRDEDCYGRPNTD